MTLRTRITVVGTIISLVLVVLVGGLAAGAARATASAQEDQVLGELSALTIARVTPFEPAALRRATPATIIDVRASSAQFVEVFDSAGSAVYSTASIDGGPVPVDLATLQRATLQSPVATSQIASGVPFRIDIRAVAHLGASSGGWVVAGESTAALTHALDMLYRFIAVCAIVLLSLGAAALWWFSRRALAPLESAAATAEAIRRDSNLGRRLPTATRSDEVGLMVTSFNGMLEELERTHQRLDTALQSQRQFLADASHELRTPLTSLASNVDFLTAHPGAATADRAAALTDIHAETARMARMVDQLLALARADAGHHLTRRPLDVRPIVEQVARQAARTYPNRVVRSEVSGALSILGDADSITQLLWILINNAVAHTGDGGTIAIRAGADQGVLILSVTDDGGGIPAADRLRIFDRFYQADASRQGGGAGLGLSIGSWIAAEHGGTIDAANVEPHGARFTVRVPLSGNS